LVLDVQEKQMTEDLTAEEVRALLKLEPHATCGFVRVTFVSEKWISAGGLPAPFAEGRPTGSALYFMVRPEAPVRLHRIRNEQLYHYYFCDPIEGFDAARRWDDGAGCSRSRVCGVVNASQLFNR
jgi:predicted cupin superfamily sugar epimerase